ncbi:hypothetical protein SERLADRAFT_466531 [Serpula lacrymans var. lacrymans S7.9]|nr:uncharacterized protein SERLADRAFT_466531 [Serpula lacrymans var. lacrymans S7.9]EGO25839.1 hypothetical protein SERLADRAFT_466531 [Serpula lacrymans var. lacrymans S7.9]
MTLFGLPPGAAPEKKSRSKTKGGEDSESQETSVSNTISDSQATDDVGGNAADFSEDATLVETRNTDPKLPSTQTFDPPEDDDEPIEWPDSPQAEVDDV